MMRYIIYIPVFICIISANIIEVPIDYGTIQDGIDNSADGDTVLVQPGTYFENINFNGHNITLGSMFIMTGDTSYISETIIDGGGGGTVVVFEDMETNDSVLEGFTIQNGLVYRGGGIMCDNNSNPTLRALIIRNNSVLVLDGEYGIGYGGGIYCQDYSSPTIDNIIIVDNSYADYSPFGGFAFGGGICLVDSSNAKISNVIIKYNDSVYGGGLAVINSSVILANVELHNNNSHFGGGGIYSIGSEISLINVNVISNNLDSLENNVGGGIFCASNCTLNLINTILWNNYSHQVYSSLNGDPNLIRIAYSDIQEGIAGVHVSQDDSISWQPGNIDLEPLFTDLMTNDFNLQHESPCIDAGTQQFLIDGDILFDYSSNDYIGDAPDMGAIEYDGLNLEGDVNCDGEVNILDILSIVDHLIGGQSPNCLHNADQNDDGIINVLDIILVISLIVG